MRQVGDEQTNSFNPTGMAIIVWTVYLIANIAWTAFPLFSNICWAKPVATTSWVAEQEIGEEVGDREVSWAFEKPLEKREVGDKEGPLESGEKLGWPLLALGDKEVGDRRSWGLSWPLETKKLGS